MLLETVYKDGPTVTDTGAADRVIARSHGAEVPLINVLDQSQLSLSCQSSPGFYGIQ